MSDATQEAIDRFYWRHGPCCAGCDWWRSARSSIAGECTASVPMSGAGRAAMLGISGSSLDIGAGYALTKREHVCGQFKDDFDWSSLPVAYRARIGALAKEPTP